MVDQVELKYFIYKKLEEVCQKLMKLLYSNLRFQKWVIKSEVCKISISLCVEDFGNFRVCPMCDLILLMNRRMTSTYATQSLMVSPITYHRDPPTIGYMIMIKCLILYVVTYILIPRKFNHVQLLKTYVIVTLLLIKNIHFFWKMR